MRLFDDTLLLSASDLTKFIGCSHATTLDLAYLRGGGPEPSADTEDAELLQKYGFEHEEKYLEKLKAAGRNILSLDSSNLAAASIATRDAMRAGVDVIYQGALLQDGWGGWADFIERVETPSDLGAYSYEVVDTKLKRSVHPTHVLQLSLYSELIGAIQGRRPVYAHVELGNGERETLRLTEYAAYAQHTRQRLANFVADPQPTRPVPCSDCALCRWSEHCMDIWTKEDSLTNVANITRGQIKKLEASGVKTLEALARHAGPVRGMLEPTFLKLKTQARLQQERKTGEPSFELRPLQEGKGFALLPEPQEGDLL